jgi:hypothetical protein
MYIPSVATHHDLSNIHCKELSVSTINQQESWLLTTFRDHWLPLLILIIPINIAVGVWVLDWPWFTFVAVVPIVSVAIGWIIRPHYIWVVWIGAVVILWISMGIWGRYNNAGPDETVGSLIAEAVIWMAMGVAVPMWIGRSVRGISST